MVGRPQGPNRRGCRRARAVAGPARHGPGLVQGARHVAVARSRVREAERSGVRGRRSAAARTAGACARERVGATTRKGRTPSERRARAAARAAEETGTASGTTRARRRRRVRRGRPLRSRRSAARVAHGSRAHPREPACRRRHGPLARHPRRARAARWFRRRSGSRPHAFIFGVAGSAPRARGDGRPLPRRRERAARRGRKPRARERTFGRVARSSTASAWHRG